MVDRSRPLAFFGALGLTGLAVGLGVGAYVLIGSPSSTPESSSTIAMSDDFCTLMDEMVAYADELSASSPDTSLLLDNTTWDDPALLDGIHTEGQRLLDAIVPLTAYLRHGAELVTDSDAAAAFEDLAVATEAQLTLLGQIALDATSIEGYVRAIFGMAGDPIPAEISNQGEVASAAVEQYVFDTCGRTILGGTGGSQDDTYSGLTEAQLDAKGDVSMLGKEIATYYVGWWPIDPQPVITLTDGRYYLLGVAIGERTGETELTGQYANGPTDWCVEVTSPGDTSTSYTYSATEGLQEGTCF